MVESIVKPLEWRNTNGREWAGDPPLRYTVYALPWGFVTNRGECGIPFGDDVHQSMEAAKKAAHDDLESLVASILSIDPASIQSLKDEVAAKGERIAELERSLLSPYCGLLVLKTMMHKAGLAGGVEVTEKALAELVALQPALPALSALRTLPVVGPDYVEQPEFIYFECKECGFDSVQKADFDGDDWCPMCESDNHDTRMTSRVCRSTDKPEGKDARAALRDTEETDASSDRLSAVEEMMGRSGGRS